MGVSEVSPAVRAFVAAHLQSLDDLQLFVILVQSGDRWWDADSVAREMVVPVQAARTVLDRLARQNLLDIRITGDVRYQFRPGSDAQRDAARLCYEAYRENPLAVTRLVAAPARRGLRDFADAFRLRRDDDDDR